MANDGDHRRDEDEQRPLLARSAEGSEDGTSTLKKYTANDVEVVVQPVAEEAVVGGEDSSGELKPDVRMSTIIFPLAIGLFLAAMDGTIVASSYASIGSELHQLQNTSWIATGYMLTLTSFQPLYGKLSDIFGRKACLVFAYSVFALGSLLCGLARNMTELVAARALAGLGGGGMTTVVSILVSDIVPLRERGTWQGILNIIFAVGSATGAPLGGILADGIGWRWAFLIQVPATLLAILAVALTLHLPHTALAGLRAKLRRIDFPGAALLVSAVFALLLALDRGGNVAWWDRRTLGVLGACAVFFALFAVVELREEEGATREPFAPRRIIAHPSLLAAYLCNLLGIASSMCAIFHVALFFQAVAGRSAASAGLGLLPAIVGGVLGSLMGGVVMQKTGKYYRLTVGMYGVELVGTVMMLGTTGLVVQSAAGTSVGLALMSLGNGAGITTTLIAIIANAAPADQAIATAVSYLFRSLGAVFGISLGSTLVQNTLRALLHKRLAGQDVDVDGIARRVRASLSSLDDLAPYVRSIVRGSYEDAVQAAFWLATALAAAAFVSSLFIREKPLPSTTRR